MELCSLNSLRVSSIIPPSGLLEKPFLRGRTINIPPCTNKRYAEARKLRILDCRAQTSSGTTIVGSEAPEAASKDVDSKDSNLVFVAGATGRVGSRTVRELLKLGFRVRAGVRNRQRAESLLQSVQQMKLDDSASGGTQPIENLEIVECDLEKPDRIVPALANASIVICCIGASEKEVFDITGPYRIDYLATKNLIDAATFAKIDHFILLTSLGTNKVGFPAAILNLFWGVLIWKRKAEEALLASGLPYTIVRPGGMERPTDSYKETHNIMLSEEDTLFGGQVSNLQVAELMAFMAKNRSLSYCKVVEVIAETTAPLTPMGDLLAKVPSQRVEVYPPEESGDADGPQPAVTDSKTAEPPSPVKEPSPTKPTSKRPLSPYTAYEDLKPPSSPSPTPSGPNETSNGAPISSDSTSKITGGNALVKTETTSPVEKDPPPSSASRHSPYLVYEDLKPPSSPSPSVPVVSGNGKPLPPLAEKSEVTQQDFTLKQKPLSPFTMYEDLKPPSSPTPSLKKR